MVSGMVTGDAGMVSLLSGYRMVQHLRIACSGQIGLGRRLVFVQRGKRYRKHRGTPENMVT